MMNFNYCNHELIQKQNLENEPNLGAERATKEGNRNLAKNRHVREICSLAGPLGNRILDFSESVPADWPVLNSLRINDGSLFSKGSTKAGSNRLLPNGPWKILDAPDLVDDYYLNLLSWGKNNVIAIALRDALYLWHAADGKIDHLCSLEGDDSHITSVRWSDQDWLVVGTSENKVLLYDFPSGKLARTLDSHQARVSALSWSNEHCFSSGGRDSAIFNHDTRCVNSVQSSFIGHTQEICGLEWSPDGKVLASGGNENVLCLWDAGCHIRAAANSNSSTSSSSSGGRNVFECAPTFKLESHLAAVKALAWCPFQRNLLASVPNPSHNPLTL
jgi:cell division cycle protein 20 (cofactor of APC complex)